MASTYLFTFFCYGMRWEAVFGAVDGLPKRGAQPPYILDARRRQLVVGAIRDGCSTRDWTLVAIHAQRDSVTLIVAAEEPAEVVQRDLREQVTRRLHQAGIDAPHRSRWARESAVQPLRTRGDLERVLRVMIGTDGTSTTTWVEPVTALRPWLRGLPG
jgi:hypothetical protein